MENLIIKNRIQSISRKIVGGLWILYAIGTIISELDSLEASDWIRSFMFLILGIFFFTRLMGSTKVQIEICDRCIKILWINWIRVVTIQENEIESILLAKNGILINRKSKKPVKLLLYALIKDQKTKVYEFFIGYAQHKNFMLEK